MPSKIDAIKAPAGRTFVEVLNMLRFASESDRRAFRDYLTAPDEDITGPTYLRPGGGTYLRPGGGSYLRPA